MDVTFCEGVGVWQVDRAAKATVQLETEILAERARVLADPRPASYFALFKCASSLPSSLGSIAVYVKNAWTRHDMHRPWHGHDMHRPWRVQHRLPSSLGVDVVS